MFIITLRRLATFAIVLLVVLSLQGVACTKDPVKPDDNDTEYFIKSEQILGDGRAFAAVIADVDMDNDNDIFIGAYHGSNRLWLNDGQGVFTQSNQSFNSARYDGTHCAAIADLNGDSYPDLFIINHDVRSKVYLNNGAGGFTDSGQNIGNAGDVPLRVQLIDVDGDGDIDAAIPNSATKNKIWLNNGSGIFTESSADYGTDSPYFWLADFNDDTFPDLFISFPRGSNQVWMNDGSGNFSNSDQILGENLYVRDIQCKDIDGDGDTDIIAANPSQLKTWVNQNNSGIFVAGHSFSEGADECILFDADNDGDHDLVTAHRSNGNKFWLNDGAGTFSLEGTIGTTEVLSIDYGKLDADDDYDLLLGKLEGTGGNEMYFNASSQ